MYVYLRSVTNPKAIFRVKTEIDNTFPLCPPYDPYEMIGGWRTFIHLRDITPGVFHNTPIVLDKNYNIIPGNYTLSTPSQPPFPENIHDPIKRIEYERYMQNRYERVDKDVSYLSECRPNIKLK